MTKIWLRDEKAFDISVATSTSKRRTQAVSTIANRRKVIRWLLAYEQKDGIDGMFAKAIDRFPDLLNSSTRAANLQKAMDWWRKWDSIMGTNRGRIVIRRVVLAATNQHQGDWRSRTTEKPVGRVVVSTAT
ncbi:LOW QUALITY PROTEIN: hypothetical protein PHMEG_00034561 [Phytophthora megakarya]|uniref:Uncharacterized protein n=1 Tax=Phytophthora megakarya TaxID=4795 RepID=A0A225UQR9_9STRA|nr:LOW QUALITY PROTEIN: hypothetical protein PHMEG_00034561 [Phytophthora megakarya]